MKSLETIQKISKFGKIVSKIIFTLCFVALIIFFVAGLCVVTLPANIEITKDNLPFLETNNIKFSKNGVYDTLIVASIGVIAEMYIAKKAEKYFEFELQEGTPFTEESANKIRKLGIIIIVAPIIASLISFIIHIVIAKLFGDVGEIELNYDISLTMGLFFLFLSAVFRYGAHLKNNENEKNV